MKVKLITCWFMTSYGDYSDGLRKALERRLGDEVGVIATNCGCGDPISEGRHFVDRRCEYFELPHIRYWRSTNPVKRLVRLTLYQIAGKRRARQYSQRKGEAEVVHFQQILNAFGSMTMFNWLALPSPAARVVTVHELDDYQRNYPEVNRKYNLADQIIVHTHDIKKRLVEFGVDDDRIDVVGHGVEIRPLGSEKREGIIFYAGHFPEKGKGTDALLKAMALLKKQLGPETPVLKVHGHYGTQTPEYWSKYATEAGIGKDIEWLNQISLEESIAQYQKSLLCVLPYTGSFAGFPAVTAMANGVPVIGTRLAGLLEHLGDAGTWVEPNDVEGLANTMLRLLNDKALQADLAAKGRRRAEMQFSWDTIAGKTLESYEKALLRKGH
jgi:glycosyltransferase involved in cell wall biosynthesis